jgi:amino-acid N-acetyltransferase
MTPEIPAARLRPAEVADLPALEELLTRAELSPVGVAETLGHFVVAECEGRIVGSVGLELYEPDALLRSAVVDSTVRGTGLGRLLVERIITDAAWFPRFGFEPVRRDAVPETVKSSVEFREICPATAVAMIKRLR